MKRIQYIKEIKLGRDLYFHAVTHIVLLARKGLTARFECNWVYHLRYTHQAILNLIRVAIVT